MDYSCGKSGDCSFIHFGSIAFNMFFEFMTIFDLILNFFYSLVDEVS